MSHGEVVPGSAYLYDPVDWAPPIFTAWFAVVTIAHIWQCIKYKAWTATGLYPLCGLLFMVGFALRSYGATHYGEVDVYLTSTIFIYCSPPILELANYYVLGRILYYVPYYSPVHPGRVLNTFGFISALVEVLNAIGISRLANSNVSEDYAERGEDLAKDSLVLQIGVIVTSCILAGIFQRQCLKGGITTRKVQGPLITLYMSMTLILIRTIYCTVEHFGSSYIPTDLSLDGKRRTADPILRYEWFFWVFEASLMLVNMVLWNYPHPRRYLPEDYSVYLAQDGRTELSGAGWKGDMPWWMTLVSPCGFTAMLTSSGRKKEKPFWEYNGYETPEIGQGRSSDAEDKVWSVEMPNSYPFGDIFPHVNNAHLSRLNG